MAFRDVVTGSAVGCGRDGFPAKVGWDAVTGFGTPVSLSPFPYQGISDITGGMILIVGIVFSPRQRRCYGR